MSVKINGSDGSYNAGVDANTNLKVNLPTTATQAGYAQGAFVRDAAKSFISRVTAEGGQYSSSQTLLFSCGFNGAAAGALLNSQFNQQGTTMTTALNAGFLRLNAGVITTLNTGISIVSWRVFTFDRGEAVVLRAPIKHAEGASSNKVVEFGFGYYDVAANQANPMNEFAGFRWTSGGNLLGVLETSTGGAPATLTVNINGGTPYADNICNIYEVQVASDRVEFWVNGVYQAQIAVGNDVANVIKSAALPIIARQYHTSAPAIAPVFDIGTISVHKLGSEQDLPVGVRQSAMGRECSRLQAGLGAANGPAATQAATAVAPSAVTMTNATTAMSGLGGLYRYNGAAIVAAVHTNYLVCSYLNPVIPETIGSALDARSLVITGVMISPQVVSTVLAGGGYVGNWFIGVGATSSTLAAADAIGTTTPGTKSPAWKHLPIIDSMGAAAAVGTVATRSGDSSITLETPLVVHPGEYLQVGFRTWQVTALVSSGTVDGAIGFTGYWL